MFARCAKEKGQLPQFVIFEPQEVSACTEEIAACVVSTVNEINRKFNGLLDRLNQTPLPWPEGYPVAAEGNESIPLFSFLLSSLEKASSYRCYRRRKEKLLVEYLKANHGIPCFL